MRRIIICAALLSGGCAQQPYPIVTSAGPTTVSDLESAGTPAPDGWQANEMIIPAHNAGPVLGIMESYRKGRTPDGFEYRYFSDGSGSVNLDSDELSMHKWNVRCQTDKMDDSRSCTLSRMDAPLIVLFAGERKPTAICAGMHDFPGKQAMFRIDGGHPIKADRSGCISGHALAEALKAKKITVRHVKWPYEAEIDTEVIPTGMTSAIGLTEYLFSKSQS
ncbi:hypothetical protein [Hyphomicrobium sp. DY-1]|uniref:hypothetical protein n=1 Tax=Hyphomicrobium sp. DY-1 TaxID=3075650 RepID=UPI0039C02516